MSVSITSPQFKGNARAALNDPQLQRALGKVGLEELKRLQAAESGAPHEFVDVVGMLKQIKKELESQGGAPAVELARKALDARHGALAARRRRPETVAPDGPILAALPTPAEEDGFWETEYRQQLVGRIELLRVRMQLDGFHIQIGEALQLRESGIPVVRVHGGNGHQLRIALGKRNELIVLCTRVLQLAEHGHMNAAEARDPFSGGIHLGQVLLHRLLAIPDVDMGIEDPFLAARQTGERQQH